MGSESQRQQQAEFAVYLQTDQTRLYGYIHSLVRDSDDADDIFQQTSLVLWRQFEQFDRNREFFAWACGVARFEVSNFLRSRSRKKLYFSDDLNLLLIDAHAQFSTDEVDARKSALSECVQKLRPRDRELLEACYADAARVQTVAEARGRIPQSVHNSLRRIRMALFECIQRTVAQTDGGSVHS